MSIYEIKRNNRIVELYQKGLILTEIAKLYNISRERIRQIIKKADEKLEVLDKRQ